MKTKYLHFNERDLDTAGRLIRKGELVAFPTETVYGLGANALDLQAVSKTYAAKGRPSDNPLIVHIYDKSQIYDIAEQISDDARKVIDDVMPAPITIVLPKRAVISDTITAGLPTVAIRMPLSEEARQFLRAAGVPVTAPSANISGRPSPTNWQRVKEDMDGKISAVMCGEPCRVGIESTVLDLSDEPRILRPGAVSAEYLSRLLGKQVYVLNDPTSKVNSPGIRYRHYAPKVPMVLEQNDDVEKLCRYFDEKTAEGYHPVLWVHEPLRFGGRNAVEMGLDDGDVANKMFETMRKLETQYDFIIASFCRRSPCYDGPAGQGVEDRLIRACGHTFI